MYKYKYNIWKKNEYINIFFLASCSESEHAEGLQLVQQVCAPVLEEFYYDVDIDVNEKCLIKLHLIYRGPHSSLFSSQIWFGSIK